MNKRLTPMQKLALREAQAEYNAATRAYAKAAKGKDQSRIAAAYDRVARAYSELAQVKAGIASI